MLKEGLNVLFPSGQRPQSSLSSVKSLLCPLHIEKLFTEQRVVLGTEFNFYAERATHRYTLKISLKHLGSYDTF